MRGARRRREKVCLRLPADSLKTERSILGVETSTSSLFWEAVVAESRREEQIERERSSDCVRRRRSINGRESKWTCWSAAMAVATAAIEFRVLKNRVPIRTGIVGIRWGWEI